MATQSRTYSGNEKQTGQNCAVNINFETQTVDFRSVGNIALWKIMVGESVLFIMGSIYYVLVPLGLTSFFAPPYIGEWFIDVWIAILGIGVLQAITKVLTPKWMENIYPIKNSWGIFGFPRKRKDKDWVQVNPDAIINNQLVLHEQFNNVLLEYKMSPEYKEQLSHISIFETLLGQSFQDSWKAVFVFKEKPKKGELWLRWN